MEQLKFQYDVEISPEAACVLCHISSSCGGCCELCAKEKGCNSAQMCSRLTRKHDGQRWDNWMHLIKTVFPELRKFVPRKFWKELK